MEIKAHLNFKSAKEKNVRLTASNRTLVAFEHSSISLILLIIFRRSLLRMSENYNNLSFWREPKPFHLFDLQLVKNHSKPITLILLLNGICNCHFSEMAGQSSIWPLSSLSLINNLHAKIGEFEITCTNITAKNDL